MEVPFLSSSAISREHYSLVQKVEAAPQHRIDDILYQEVEMLQRRLEMHRPTSHECVETLVLLLYCATATLGRITHAMLEFAIPHAITLAESGSSINQKRIGYLFCNEIMTPEDELQIMLVNTLRKDLEDPTVCRICLALDALSMNCPSDAIPAVTPRLLDLLAHDSANVKRKTMTVIRRIGLQDPDTLLRAKAKALLRLSDPDPDVSGAALRLVGALTQARVITPQEALDLVLELYERESGGSNRAQEMGLRVRLAEFLGALVNHMDDDLNSTRVIETLYQMLTAAKDHETVLILEIFRALSNHSTSTLIPYFSSKGPIANSILGRFLASPKPNMQYFCLGSLLALDPTLWAGTTDLIPPAFDEIQVHVIMGLLDSPDNSIRRKALQVMYRVDPQILSLHLAQLHSSFQSSSRDERDSIAGRLLEASAVSDIDGGTYASRFKDICTGLESRQRHYDKRKSTDSGAGLVSESLVEEVLLHLRTRPTEFRKAFVDTTARIPASDAGPTLTLVVAAAACEYGGLSSIPQEDLLRGLSTRLEVNSPAIQEALLLAMLRITARCDSVLPDVADQVRTLYELSKTHIRRRCNQYLSFSEDLTALKHVAAMAKSDSLPDFIYVLENAEKSTEVPTQRRNSSPKRASRSQVATGKLRYEAYDPPRPAPKLTRRPSSTTSIHSFTTSRSARSDSISSSHSHSRRRYMNTSGTSDDPDDILSRTLTAGDLAFVAHEPKFTVSTSNSNVDARRTNSLLQPEGPHHLIAPPLALETPTDLIAFESPFLTDLNEAPQEPEASLDFDSMWDSLKAGPTFRGWCGISPEQATKRVETLPNHHVTISPLRDHTRNEILLVISSLGGEQHMDSRGALRLRAGEEESTLWQLRCFDPIMKATLKKLLDDA